MIVTIAFLYLACIVTRLGAAAQEQRRRAARPNRSAWGL
jgi:hypothetical protein